jgi:GGDEF domain-containing protein
MTELRGAEEKLRYLSNFDALTGLPNRTLMRERMRQLQQKDAGGRVIGYLLLNPERLQLVGESLGTDAEQALLVQVAERLGQWGHVEAGVGRVGERSFAIIAARKDATELSVLARQCWR